MLSYQDSIFILKQAPHFLLSLRLKWFNLFFFKWVNSLAPGRFVPPTIRKRTWCNPELSAYLVEVAVVGWLEQHQTLPLLVCGPRQQVIEHMVIPGEHSNTTIRHFLKMKSPVLGHFCIGLSQTTCHQGHVHGYNEWKLDIAGFEISLVRSSEMSKNDSRTSGIPAGLVRRTTAYFWFSHKLHWLYMFQISEWYIRTSDIYNPLARWTSTFNLKFRSLYW